MEFYFPSELGEQMAFLSAVATALLGLGILLFPAQAMKASAFRIGDIRPEGYAAVRSLGAHHLGFGLVAILLAQDWIYLALGVAMAFAALGRLFSCVLDRSATSPNIAILLLQALLAAGPLAYAFGYL